MISKKAKEFAAKIHILKDDDLLLLADALVEERYRRSLRHQKCNVPLTVYQRRQRAYRILQNGQNEMMQNFRKKHNLSQSALGQMLGKSTATISHYEMGALKTPVWITEQIERWEADGIM